MPKQRKKYRRIKRVILFLFLIFFVYFFIFGKCGVIKIIRLKFEEAQLDRKAENLRAKEMVLEHELRHLKSDTLFIEKVAKKRLGMVKKEK